MKKGDKVHYIRCEGTKPENGIIKSNNSRDFSDVFVVFNCAGNWKYYDQYTGQSTPIKKLHLGWYMDEDDKVEEVEK